jgi:sugar/nucleoside kinase (ribokinase family)
MAEYLVIGHVTLDRSPAGDQLGGTVAYAGMTARAYGARTRLLTACREDTDLSLLKDIDLRRIPASRTTIFENIYHGDARAQRILSAAEPIHSDALPADWQYPDIVHLAPVAGEIGPDLLAAFPQSLVGATLQGWMRAWGPDGEVRAAPRDMARAAAKIASAIVFSLDDVHGIEREAQKLADLCPVAAVTEGACGCRVYWNGHVRRFPVEAVEPVDPTGAGDIFAAIFFLRLHETRDPFEAARMANVLATRSVTRAGMESIPSRAEILEAKTVVLAQ